MIDEFLQQDTVRLLAAVVAILVVASAVSALLSRRASSPSAVATVRNLSARIRSWWVMAGVVALSLWLGRWGIVALFGLISFCAFREFVTLTPTRRSDHRVLFWAFFLILPIQYLLVGVSWYGLFTIFIPVYAFVFIPIRKAFAGETERFLETTARIQWGLLVCVYFVSHVPMTLFLPLKGVDEAVVRGHGNTSLFFFLLFTVQMSDVMQYVWGKSVGRRPVAPSVSPGKTVEGLVLGVLSASGLATLMWWATPFSPLQAFVMAFILCLFGFFGGLVMSAIKRDLGVKDWGASIGGHGGFLDRVDSLCFAAPIFFHLTGFYFGTGMDPAPPQWLHDLLRLR